jgi:hypothetical protein
MRHVRNFVLVQLQFCCNNAFVLHDHAGATEPDMAAAIDKPDEILADELGVSLAQARQILVIIERYRREELATALGAVIGWMLSGGNVVAKIYGLAFAAGLHQLNGLHSQSEAARQLGVTRALLSHYVVAARDAIGIRVTKYRKSDASRESYRRTQNRINHPNQRNK